MRWQSGRNGQSGEMFSRSSGLRKIRGSVESSSSESKKKRTTQLPLVSCDLLQKVRFFALTSCSMLRELNENIDSLVKFHEPIHMHTRQHLVPSSPPFTGATTREHCFVSFPLPVIDRDLALHVCIAFTYPACGVQWFRSVSLVTIFIESFIVFTTTSNSNGVDYRSRIRSLSHTIRPAPLTLWEHTRTHDGGPDPKT